MAQAPLAMGEINEEKLYCDTSNPWFPFPRLDSFVPVHQPQPRSEPLRVLDRLLGEPAPGYDLLSPSLGLLHHAFPVPDEIGASTTQEL